MENGPDGDFAFEGSVDEFGNVWTIVKGTYRMRNQLRN